MCRTVVAASEPEVLGLLVERRWQIVSARQKTLVQIHEQLVKLIEGGDSKRLSATSVAKLLRSIRPSDPVAAQRRRMVKELLAELRVLDRKRKAINAELDQALDDYDTSLLDIDGIGRIGAATIISIVGDVRRFPTGLSRLTVGCGRSHGPTSRSRPGSVRRACASGWPGASWRWRG